MRKIGRWYIWVQEKSPKVVAYRAADRRTNWWIVASIGSFIAASITCVATADVGGWPFYTIPSVLSVLGVVSIWKVARWHERSHGKE